MCTFFLNINRNYIYLYFINDLLYTRTILIKFTSKQNYISILLGSYVIE